MNNIYSQCLEIYALKLDHFLFSFVNIIIVAAFAIYNLAKMCIIKMFLEMLNRIGFCSHMKNWTVV